MIQLNVYKFDSKLNFGQYKGQKLINVIKRNPDYLDWCLINLPGFLVLQEDLDEIQKQVNTLVLSDKAEYILNANLSVYKSQQEFNEFLEDKRLSSFEQLDPVTPKELEDLNNRSILYLLELNSDEYKRRLRNQRWADKYLDEILDDYIQVKNRLNQNKKESNDSGVVCPCDLEELFRRLLLFHPEQQDKIDGFNQSHRGFSGSDDIEFW